MYLRGMGTLIASPQQKEYIGTPTEYLGSGCPSGMIATQPSYRDNNQNLVTKCATIRPAAPVQQAAPQSNISFNPTVNVSPGITTQISPQISPGFIQSSGGGTQSTGAQQTGGTAGSQGGGQGLTAGDVQKLLAQQQADQQAAAQAAALQQQQVMQAQIETLKAQQAQANAEQQLEYQKQIDALKTQQAQAAAAAQPAPTQTVVVPTPAAPVAQMPNTPPAAPTILGVPVNVDTIAISIAIFGGIFYFATRNVHGRRQLRA